MCAHVCAAFDRLRVIAEEECNHTPPARQIVFVSMDSDADSFEEYYAEQPWKAIPFSASAREAIPEKFGVSGIPHVIVLSGKDGSVVSKDARSLITAKKTLSGIF